MKKLLRTLLVILITIPVFGYFNTETVFGDGAYEVAYIQDDGSFKQIATFNDLDSARNKMKENEDYVVRHNNSHSPSKIIAMNSGFVYTYPYRRGYSTLNLYEKINSSLVGTGVTTYLAEHYEMTYHSTYYYHESKGFGYVEVTMNGFHGYCDLEYTDLVPTKYIEKQIPITLGGEDNTGSYEEPFSVKIKQNYYYVNEHDGYRDLVFCYHRAWSKNQGGDCLESKISIGVAPDFMKKDVHYYSNDGINFYKDGRLNELVGTYYNYYQFLPLRTKTNISADTMNAFINKNAGSNSIIRGETSAFVDGQNKYGCNAATILSMAIHESAWGTSNIARGKNNLFGWGAFDDATSNATTYASVASCVNAQMADNLANYMDVRSSRYFTMSLGNKGGGFITKYASDPYWAEKIAANYYMLDKYSAGNANGKLTDYGTYELALVKTNNANVKDTINGSTILKTANKTGYQKNLIIAKLSEEAGYIKFNTPNPIDGKEVIYPIELPYGTLVDYNFDDSVGYINVSDLILLNNGVANSSDDIGNADDKPQVFIDPSNLNGLASISNFELNNNTIVLSGRAFIEKINFVDETKINHKLVIKSLINESIENIFDLQTSKVSDFSLYDGFTYEYIGYSGSVNLKELEVGDYSLYIRVTNDEYTIDIPLKSSNNKYYNLTSKVGEFTNRIKTNEKYSYRFELEIISTPLDYSTILKPTMNRTSMFTYLSNSIDDELNLTIEANAMIYYLDYDDINSVKYETYLIQNANNYKKLNTEHIACPYDYNTLLNPDNDMSNICFKATGNIADLDGTYRMVVKITNTKNNKTYIDYVDMYKKQADGLASIIKDDKLFKIQLSPANRTVLIANYKDE